MLLGNSWGCHGSKESVVVCFNGWGGKTTYKTAVTHLLHWSSSSSSSVPSFPLWFVGCNQGQILFYQIFTKILVCKIFFLSSQINIDTRNNTDPQRLTPDLHPSDFKSEAQSEKIKSQLMNWSVMVVGGGFRVGSVFFFSSSGKKKKSTFKIKIKLHHRYFPAFNLRSD